MKKKENLNINEIEIPAFGYELIRNELMSELLHKEESSILYWAGKNLARRYPLTTNQSIIDFFSKAGWGELTVVNEKKSEVQFELTSELIQYRFETKNTCSYKLESGFLAEQIQNITGSITESFDQVKPKLQKILFTVRSDHKDKL
jgi:predicted hydrocarbon binding protein